jgi:hypothetical protein
MSPSSPARNAFANSAGVTAVTAPVAMPARISSVPYSGPLVPPTVLTRVMPAFFSSASTVLASSSVATTAAVPRAMLVPWSASPMAESRSVR